MPLDCEHHSVFNLLFHLRWEQMARVGWSWVFSFPQVSWALIKPQAFYEEQSALVFFKMIPFLSPARNMRALFSKILWELGWVSGVKFRKIVMPPCQGTPSVSLALRVFHMNLQQFVNCSSGFSTPALVPLVVLARESLLWKVIFCICVWVSPISGTAVCPVFSPLSLSWILEGLLIFQ